MMRALRLAALTTSMLVVAPSLAVASEGEGGVPGTWLNWLLSLRVAGHALAPSPGWLTFYWALLVIAVLAIACALGTRRLAVRARPKQLMLEMFVGGICNLLETVLGRRAGEFLPFLGALFIYIACMNLLGLAPGMMAPTSNLNTTASLAIISFVVIHYTGFRESKLGYLKHFVQGVPLGFSLKASAILTLLAMLPVAALILVSHAVTTIFLPVTLAMRLYGNVMGEEKVVESLIGLVAHSPARWIPVQLPNVLLGVVTSVVQAVIFAMLTAVNLSLVLHEEHEAEVSHTT